MWSALTGDNTGGSLIQSYNLEWDVDGTATTFKEIVGQTSAFTFTSYIMASQITYGQTYNFRVRAKNKWGFGPYSPTVEIQASTNPNIPFAPITIIEGANVKISWQMPLINGAVIDAYQILI